MGQRVSEVIGQTTSVFQTTQAVRGKGDKALCPPSAKLVINLHTSLPTSLPSVVTWQIHFSLSPDFLHPHTDHSVSGSWTRFTWHLQRLSGVLDSSVLNIFLKLRIKTALTPFCSVLAGKTILKTRLDNFLFLSHLIHHWSHHFNPQKRLAENKEYLWEHFVGRGILWETSGNVLKFSSLRLQTEDGFQSGEEDSCHRRGLQWSDGDQGLPGRESNPSLFRKDFGHRGFVALLRWPFTF